MNSVNFEQDVEFEHGFDQLEVADIVINAVLKEEACPTECEVEILLTDPETVREANKEYRDIDKTTDVLSFPNVEWDAPADYECEGFLDEYLINPETGKLMLGQIVLNADRIVSQAKEYGHSIKREYAFLIAHSMLHLLGYDHMEEAEAHVMEEKQKTYLNNMGIAR